MFFAFSFCASFLVAFAAPRKRKGREPAHFPPRHDQVPTETSAQAAPTGACLALSRCRIWSFSVETGSQSYRKVVVVVLHTFCRDTGVSYHMPLFRGKSISGIFLPFLVTFLSRFHTAIPQETVGLGSSAGKWCAESGPNGWGNVFERADDRMKSDAPGRASDDLRRQSLRFGVRRPCFQPAHAGFSPAPSRCSRFRW